jgi:hypothetical protein
MNRNPTIDLELDGGADSTDGRDTVPSISTSTVGFRLRLKFRSTSTLTLPLHRTGA